MPRKDIYHDSVKNVLIKDGWTITHDPLTLSFGDKDIYVDIGMAVPETAFRYLQWAIGTIDYKKTETEVNCFQSGIADELEEAGVPKDKIVLGFRSPDVRKYTGYAVC
ncbi:TPA: hypothetical protein EYP66_17540 [Candidatus Poribacteria bacterium]|nr:hypothetical protein [Candidatus Poribacteria bacterium]